MSKIYIVTSGDYDDYCVDKVFFSKEKAELYTKEQNNKLKNLPGKDGEFWRGRYLDWYITEEHETVDQIQFNLFNFDIIHVDGYPIQMSPGFQSWMEPLPIPSHIGRKVKTPNGIKIVKHHWINLDDCSGTYGQHLYSFTDDENMFNNSMATKVKDCKLLD